MIIRLTFQRLDTILNGLDGKMGYAPGAVVVEQWTNNDLGTAVLVQMAATDMPMNLDNHPATHKSVHVRFFVYLYLFIEESER